MSWSSQIDSSGIEDLLHEAENLKKRTKKQIKATISNMIDELEELHGLVPMEKWWNTCNETWNSNKNTHTGLQIKGK